MKKITALCIAIILASSLCAAFAEEWTCPDCGSGNFSSHCENCGRFSAKEVIGRWKFEVLGTAMYLTVLNETDYSLGTSVFATMEGTYAVSGRRLIFSYQGEEGFSGEYNAEEDLFTIVFFVPEEESADFPLSSAITGSRTDEDLPSLPFYITMDGESMLDTIRDGDMLTVESRELSEYERFDIVLVHYPDRGDALFVKRLIGFPGDTVELADGYLYINGTKYDEEYISDQYRTGLMCEGRWTVPEDSYFVMGDGRNNSNDIRFIGPLPSEMLVGLVVSVNGIPLEE